MSPPVFWNLMSIHFHLVQLSSTLPPPKLPLPSVGSMKPKYNRNLISTWQRAPLPGSSSQATLKLFLLVFNCKQVTSLHENIK